MQASPQTVASGAGPVNKKRTTLRRALTLIGLLLSIALAIAVYTAIFLFRQHRIPSFTQSAPPTVGVTPVDSVYIVEYRATSFDKDSISNDMILYLEDGSHQIARQMSKEQIMYIEKFFGQKQWYFDKKTHTVVTRDKD